MNLRKNKWLKKDYQELTNYLQTLKEEKFLEFTQKIVSSHYIMLGIKIPLLRKMAKEIAKGDIQSFLAILENKYYEEIMLKGFVIAYITDLTLLKEEIREFIPLIDNWAICDSFGNSLKIINQNKKEFFKFIKPLLKRKEEYIVRFSIVLLIYYYVEEKYLKEIFNICLSNNNNKYYVNMALAWLLCECFIKYPDETKEFLKNNKINDFVLKKTISKINDSYQVKKENKLKLADFV